MPNRKAPKIAEVLEKHYWGGTEPDPEDPRLFVGAHCICGAYFNTINVPLMLEYHRHHVAEKISEALA